MVLLDTSYILSHVFWFGITFCFLCWSVSRFFLKKVHDTQTSRVQSIKEGEKAIERLSLDLDEERRARIVFIEKKQLEIKSQYDALLKHIDQTFKEELDVLNNKLSREIKIFEENLNKKKENLHHGFSENLKEITPLFHTKMKINNVTQRLV